MRTVILFKIEVSAGSCNISKNQDCDDYHFEFHFQSFPIMIDKIQKAETETNSGRHFSAMLS